MRSQISAVQVSESLLRLQRIIVRFRWGAFVLAVVAGVYVRQMGLLDSIAIAKLFAFAGLLGIVSGLDEYLLRQAPHNPRSALYGIALGDWLVVTVASALAPPLAHQYPFVFFLPIVVASIGLGMPGGVSLALLSTLSLTVETWLFADATTLREAPPWIGALLVSGVLAGYVGQQWETTQRQVEATYRWVADLSAAITLAEVAEVILRYLENMLQIKGAAGAGVSGGEYATALLTPDDEEGRFSAYLAKGIPPETRARLRVSTSGGIVSWSVAERRPVWISLEDPNGPLVLPEVEDLDRFKSCLVVPISAEGKLLALGMAFSTRLSGHGETEFWGERTFSQQAASALKKSMAYTQLERQVSEFANILDKVRSGSLRDVGEVLQWAVEEARELVTAGTAALAIRDKQGNLVIASRLGHNIESLIEASGPSKSSPGHWVIDHKAPVIISDYPNDTRFSPEASNGDVIRSAMLVPLKTMDEVFGVLAAGSSGKAHFSQNDLMMFITLGQQVSLVLEQSQLQREARELREAPRGEGRAGWMPESPAGLGTAQFRKLQSEVEAKMKEFVASSKEDRPYENLAAIFAQELGTMYQLLLQQATSSRQTEDASDFYEKQLAAFSEELGHIHQLVLQQGQELRQAADLEDTHRRQMETYAREVDKLYELVQGQAKQISEAEQELERAQQHTVLALVMGLERNYAFLAGSGEAVAQLSAAIGHKFGCTAEEEDDLYYAGLLRDIGLMGVAPELLLTPNLDGNQMAQVRRHSEIGYTISSSFPFLTNVAIVIRHHHERWDGEGYPDRLAGERIPLGSRVLAVADTYEALTAARSYREAISPREALDTIMKNAGKQFDPAVCKAFATVFEKRRDIASQVLSRLPQSR